VEVARNDTTFCPVDKDKLAFYTIVPQTLTAALPAGWKAGEMAAVTLSPDKRVPVYFRVGGNWIEVSVNAQQPIMIYRKKEAAHSG
jgi:hypothetical protein